MSGGRADNAYLLLVRIMSSVARVSLLRSLTSTLIGALEVFRVKDLEVLKFPSIGPFIVQMLPLTA
jgi:hypothetical protein